MPKPASKAKDKKLAKKEAAQRALQTQALIKSLKQDADLLSGFPAFQKYARRGVDAEIKYYSCDTLPPALMDWVFDLTKRNVSSYYENCPGWGWNDGKKRREMQAEEARYIVVTGKITTAATAAADSAAPQQPPSTEDEDLQRPLAFVHLRFETEKEDPVAYVYEIQVESSAQGRGLGKFLMQLVELTSRKAGLAAIMLTVFTENVPAGNLYSSLGYTMDGSSPGMVEPEGQHGYEILSKKLPQKVVEPPSLPPPTQTTA